MCKTIKQKIKFNFSPEIVYALLMETKKHEAVTGRKAVISSRVGEHSRHIMDILLGLMLIYFRGKNRPSLEGIRFSRRNFFYGKFRIHSD